MSKIRQKCNKKSLQAISKAEYHIHNIKSSENQTPQQNDNQLQYWGGLNFSRHFTINQQYQGQKITNSHVLFDSIKKLYLTNNASKINENLFVKTHSLRSSYLPIYEQFNQLIDILKIQKQTSQPHELDLKQKKSFIRITQKPSPQQKNTVYNQYIIYVIHHCNFSEKQSSKSLLKWENFVQKYEFKNQYSEIKKAHIDKIKYSMVFTYVSKSSSSFNFLNINKSSSIEKNFLLSYFDQKLGNEENIKKLQSYIFQHEKIIQEKQLQLDQQRKKYPCYSQDFRRQKHIPAQHFMAYKKLKEELYKIYAQVNKQFIAKGQIVDHQMKFQNTVCKFMQDYNNDIKTVRQKVLQFVKWQNDLRTKYNMKVFKKYLDMDILIDLGTDRVGRPVVLFKTYNFIVDKIFDIQEYCKFFFYFLIIHVMSKTRGYTDDLIVIGDARNNTSKNFKMQVNKIIITTGVSILPRHFFRIVVYGNNALSLYIYKLVSIWLPKYAEQTIKLFNDNFQDVKQLLSQFIDNDVIPQLLGGANTICNDILKSQMTTKQMDDSTPAKKKFM